MPVIETIKIRRDTATNWTTADPILSNGEMGYETDTQKIKFGDGYQAWSTLPYAAGGGGSVTAVTAQVPLIVTSGTTTPNITIPAATNLIDGYDTSANVRLLELLEDVSHNILTTPGTTPLSLTNQALKLVNDASTQITEIDTGSLANLDTVIPTSKAVKTAITDASLNVLIYKGVIDCSANPNYPAATVGDVYVVSVAGKIGGAGGVDVAIGDELFCNTTTVGGDQATVGTKWNILITSITGAVTGPASATDNAITRFDLTTGQLIQNSPATLDDAGSINIPTGETYDINGTPHTHVVPKLDDLATPDNNTDLNATNAVHGLLRKLTDVPNQYLDASGNWSVPAGGSGGSGEVNTASNLGAPGDPSADGHGLWKDKNVYDLRFKRIKAGTGISITSETNDILIAAAMGAGTDTIVIYNDSGTYRGFNNVTGAFLAETSTTDAAYVINAAIAAIKVLGTGSIGLRGGNFNILNPIVINTLNNSRFKIHGAGVGNTTIQVNADASCNVFEMTGAASLITISDMRLWRTDASHTRYGIKFVGTACTGSVTQNDIRLENLQITNFEYGIYAYFMENSWITNVLAESCIYGFYLLNCGVTRMSGCLATSGSNAGFYFEGSYEGAGGSVPSGACDEGCYLVNCTSNGQYIGIKIVSKTYVGASACSWTSALGGALIITGATGDQKSGHIKFAACEFGGGTSPGVNIGTNCEDIVFTACNAQGSTPGMLIAGNHIGVNICTFGDNYAGVSWNNSVTYQLNNFIIHDGIKYFCILSPCYNKHPPDEPSYWCVIGALDIILVNAIGCTINNNICYPGFGGSGVAPGIVETGSSDYNCIMGNSVQGVVTINGAHTIGAGTNLVY